MADSDNELSFNDNEMTAVYWPGNGTIAPTVELEIDAHRVIYDRDYGTEEKIKGSFDLKREDAEKLYHFLAAKFGFGEVEK